MNDNNVNGNKGMGRGVTNISSHLVVPVVKEVWEEEFEDEISVCEAEYEDPFNYISSETNGIYEAIEKYIGSWKKVKIYCKKGKIVIEEI